MGGGHYTAQCRSAADGGWYTCNDSSVVQQGRLMGRQEQHTCSCTDGRTAEHEPISSLCNKCSPPDISTKALSHYSHRLSRQKVCFILIQVLPDVCYHEMSPEDQGV